MKKKKKKKNEVTTVISMISRGGRQLARRHLHIAQVARAIQTIISVPRASDLFVVHGRAPVSPSPGPCVLVIGTGGQGWPQFTRDTRDKDKTTKMHLSDAKARWQADGNTLARANRDSELMSHGETAMRFLSGHRTLVCGVL